MSEGDLLKFTAGDRVSRWTRGSNQLTLLGTRRTAALES